MAEARGQVLWSSTKISVVLGHFNYYTVPAYFLRHISSCNVPILMILQTEEEVLNLGNGFLDGLIDWIGVCGCFLERLPGHDTGMLPFDRQGYWQGRRSIRLHVL